MKFILRINGTESANAAYVGWTPVKCSLTIDGFSGDSPMPVTITAEHCDKSGRIDLYTNNSPGDTPVDKIQHDFQTRNELKFFVAGRFGNPSVAEKDTYILVKHDSSVVEELQKNIMVRVRKNANKLSQKEIDLFLKTFISLNACATSEPYSGRFTVKPSSLLSEIVLMHTYDAQFEIHSRESFHPWHRAYLMHLEREMQKLKPEVTIPYWKFDDKAENVFKENFLGRTKKFNPKEEDRYFDCNVPEFSPDNPMFHYKDHTIWGPLTRSYRFTDPADGKSNPSIRNQSDVISYSDEFIKWYAFEEQSSHNQAHNAFNGRVTDVGKDPVDPLFFLMHSNVDRLWALWQHTYNRFDAEHSKTYSLPYSYEGLAGEEWTDANPEKFDLRAGFFKVDSYDLGNFADDKLWPWGIQQEKDELTGQNKDAIHRLSRPWRKYSESGYGSAIVPELFLKFPESPISIYPQGPPRVKDTIDYQGRIDLKSALGFDYDDIPYFDKDKTSQNLPSAITPEQYNEAFLDKKRTVDERLESAKSALLFGKKHNDAALEIIANKDQSIKIRLEAVRLIYEVSDEFLDVALRVIKEETRSINEIKELDKIELTSELIHKIFTAKRSNRNFASRRPFFFDILRGLLSCNNVKLRHQAFEILASQGDGEVEEILYTQARNEFHSKGRRSESPLISTVDALFLLRQNPKNQHTEVFYKLAEESQNTEIRKGAIAGLDNAFEYEDFLKKVVTDESESFGIRWASAQSLHRWNQEAMNELAAQIISEPKSGDGIKLFRSLSPDPEEVDFKAGLLNMLTFTGNIDRLKQNENLKSSLKEVADSSTANKGNFRSSFEALTNAPSASPTIIEQMAAKLLNKFEASDEDE